MSEDLSKVKIENTEECEESRVEERKPDQISYRNTSHKYTIYEKKKVLWCGNSLNHKLNK